MSDAKTKPNHEDDSTIKIGIIKSIPSTECRKMHVQNALLIMQHMSNAMIKSIIAFNGIKACNQVNQMDQNQK